MPDHAATVLRPIRVLPAPVVARIAAGEVIERPASVVKELVENALDAGARQIRIDVQGGGLGLIRVSDDGCGIPGAEMPLACMRHATSKLPDDDLEQVRTLGFRGEALPSIAAVAELTLVSATDDSGVGHRLVLRGGSVVVSEPSPRSRGTTVAVRHLFQNVPARLSASGRPQTEISHITQTVRRLALAAPHVRMSLYIDGRLTLHTDGSGDLGDAMVAVYGAALAGRLIPLGPIDVASARISGFVAGPELTRPGRGQVTLIVNGRPVEPRGLLAQVETTYRPVLPRGRHPVLAVSIDVPPELVDINIHPAKLEVRLRAEREIGAAIGELVRGALGRHPLPLRVEPAGGAAALAPTLVHLAEARPAWDDDGPIVTPGLPPLRLIDQVQGRLLLLEGDDGLYLVDQHRAHERVIFEHLVARHGQGGPEPVLLPEPLLLELRPAQVARFARRLDDLAALGFQCETFGGRMFLLRAAPALPGVFPTSGGTALAGVGEADGLVAELVALADSEPGEGEGWRQELLVRLACRSAVRRGRRLERPAMRALVEALGHTRTPAVCPHGSPLLVHVSDTLLERQFGWR